MNSKIGINSFVAVGLFFFSMAFGVAGLFCNYTANRPCNSDFGITDYVCPTPFTETDVDYFWCSAGANMNECVMLSLQQSGGKEACTDDGFFGCAYTTTIAWCDGTTEPPYACWVQPTPQQSHASGSSCDG